MAERQVADMVRHFHRSFGLPVGRGPTVEVPTDLALTRRRLIAEEADEVARALGGGERAEIAKELADLVYVLYGTALTYGIDLDAAVAAVHDSNMTKLGSDGRPVLRGDGKVLKGPNYRPPDLQGALGPGS